MAHPEEHVADMTPCACAVCGARATRLCDFPIGWLSEPGRRGEASAWMYRCDVPLCDAHARQDGSSRWSRELAEVGVQGVDLCPHCVRLSDRSLRQAPIDQSRIERHRRTARLWCERGGTWQVLDGGRS